MLGGCGSKAPTAVEEPELLHGQRFPSVEVAREATVAAIVSSPEVIELVGSDPVVTREVAVHQLARQLMPLAGPLSTTVMREGESFLIEGASGSIGATYTVERRNDEQYFLTEWRLVEGEELENLREWAAKQKVSAATE